jgi:hypothetical protein
LLIAFKLASRCLYFKTLPFQDVARSQTAESRQQGLTLNNTSSLITFGPVPVCQPASHSF